MSVFATNPITSAYAAQVNAEEDVEAQVQQTYANYQQPSLVTGWKTDSQGNRFVISGQVTRTEKKAAIKTTFTTSYYHAGTADAKEALDKKKKSISVNGGVSLLGGGSNTLRGSISKEGSSYTLVKEKDYLYTVMSVYGIHDFSFQGISWTGSTQM